MSARGRFDARRDLEADADPGEAFEPRPCRLCGEVECRPECPALEPLRPIDTSEPGY